LDLKPLKKTIRKATDPLEATILANDYFPLQKSLSYPDKLRLMWKDLQLRMQPQSAEVHPEVTFLLYSKACERLLIPLIMNLLQRSEVEDKGIQVNVIVLFGIHCLQLSPTNLEQLRKLGCQIQTDYFSLIRACHQPEQKLVIFCLDHRRAYAYHFWGVEAVDTLKRFGVKTLSIQHGGTRADSVADLASAASDTVLVWGNRIYREITERYGGDPKRFRPVGNPLHDRLTHIKVDQALKHLIEYDPSLSSQLPQKRLILLATTLQLEYASWANEQSLYRKYIRYLYDTIDFSKYILLIKMHPLDSLSPNLYREEIPNTQVASSVVIIESSVTELDVYSLLTVSELLITRASTVAEEALIMGRPVITFDLMREGPSKNYKHLEDYGSYITVYPDSELNLREVIDTFMADFPTEKSHTNQSEIIHDLTYCLDGQSAQRGTDEILKQLFEKVEFNQLLSI